MSATIIRDAFARRDDPWTSHDAAIRVDTLKLQVLVAQTIWSKRRSDPRFAKGMTTAEIEEATGKLAGSITPRMHTLEKRGIVRRVGYRVPLTRRKRRTQTIWQAVPYTVAVAFPVSGRLLPIA